MKRAVLVLVLACVGASALAACSRETIQPGEARLSFDRARVQVASRGGSLRVVDDDDTSLQSGDRVKVVTGDAELRLARGALLLLADGSDVTVGRAPIVRSGDVIVDVEDEPLSVQSAGSTVTVRPGATRVRSGLALTAGVYSGSARVTTADRSIDLPALRQATVAAFGVLPANPSPLEYREADAWDRQYLGPAIDIGLELQRRSDGFSAQLRSDEGLTPGFYELLLPELPADAFDQCRAALRGSLGEGRRPGEILVGSSLALQGRRGTFTERCRSAFAFRDAGATWGLVALDQGTRSLPRIREQLVVAIGRLPGEATLTALGEAPTPSAPVAPIVAAAEAPAGPAPATPVSPVGPAAPPTPAPVAPTDPGLPEVPPLLPSPDEPEDGVLTPVTELVDNLLSGLLG